MAGTRNEYYGAAEPPYRSTGICTVVRELSQAGFFVSAVNLQIIRNFQGQNNPLRKVKTDKADSIKIARYTLDSWANLKQYSLMDKLRSQLI